MKINPSPSYSMDLAVDSTRYRSALENIIAVVEGVVALAEGTASPYRFVVYAREAGLAREVIDGSTLYKLR